VLVVAGSVGIFMVLLSLLLLLGIGAGRDAISLAISLKSKSLKSMFNDVQVVQQVWDEEGEGSCCC